MSTLRTFNLQNPDSGTVNIEMDQGGNTLMTGIATVRGAAHFTSTSGSDAVGIGTDITAYKLDVRVTGAEAGLRVYNPDTSSNASGILRLGNDDNQNSAFLMLNGANNSSSVGGAANLVLGTGTAREVHLATSGTSRLRITSSGNVSIGSLTDDSIGSTTTLTIDRSSGNGQISFAANGTVRGRIFADNSTSDFRIGNPTSNDLMLYTNNLERLRITSSGIINSNNYSFNSQGTNTASDVYLGAFAPGSSAYAIATNGAERVRITSDGKFGFNTTSPAGQVHIKGNTDGSANPSIILDDNGDTRRCYITNTSGDMMLGGIDSGTVQSRLTIHENGNMYHQRLNSSGSLQYQFQTGSSQTGGAASGNTYVEHMAFRQGDGLKHGSFVMTIYGDGGDNYMPVLFTKHGYHPTNSSFGGQWFGEMWLNNAGSINPQNYNHTGFNNWATTSFKYRWDCAHWNAKPTMSIIEHHVNYGRTNIADLEISGTQSYFVMWLLPGVYRVTYSAWEGLNAWWTNNNNVGGALTHREGGGNTTRAVRAYSGRDTRYDSNISWGTQGQT